MQKNNRAHRAGDFQAWGHLRQCRACRALHVVRNQPSGAVCPFLLTVLELVLGSYRSCKAIYPSCCDPRAGSLCGSTKLSSFFTESVTCLGRLCLRLNSKVDISRRLPRGVRTNMSSAPNYRQANTDMDRKRRMQRSNEAVRRYPGNSAVKSTAGNSAVQCPRGHERERKASGDITSTGVLFCTGCCATKLTSSWRILQFLSTEYITDNSHRRAAGQGHMSPSPPRIPRTRQRNATHLDAPSINLQGWSLSATGGDVLCVMVGGVSCVVCVTTGTWMQIPDPFFL